MATLTHSLVDPTGKKTAITAEQASSYSQGANTLASGYKVMPNSVQTMRQAVIPPAQSTFKTQTVEAIPSTALTQGGTINDARNQRSAMEAQQSAQLTSRQMFEQGLSGIQNNPQSTDFLSGLMFPDATQTAQQRDTLVTEQRGLMQQARDFISGRRTDSAGRLTDLQEEAGLPDLQARIATSNERVAQLRGELMKVRPQVETEAGQTRIGAEARLGPVERNLQAEIASEALVQAALVGNANMVQGNIDKILELEFQDQQMELNDMMLGIQMVAEEIKTLDPKLQEEANQRLAQFNFALQERASALQTAQANKAQTLELMAQVAQNGAPDSVLQAMRNAQTPEQAMTIGGAYMSDPLDRQLKQAQLNKLNAPAGIDWGERAAMLKAAEAGDPLAIEALGYDPAGAKGGIEGARQYENETASIQAGINAAKAMLENKRGLNATTGALQSPLLGGFFAGGKADGSFSGLFSRIPIVGNIQGAVQSKQDAMDFLGNAALLVNDTTFKSVLEMKAQGVTFGAMTEGERVAAGRAATALNAAARVDESGNITGFNATPATIEKHINDVMKAYEGRQEYLNIKYGVNRNEIQEGQALWGNN